MNTKLILAIFVLGLAVAQILVVASLAGRGQDLAVLEIEIEELREENQIIRNQIGSLASLSKVASQSSQLGFGEPEKLLYLVPQEPVAQK